MLLILKCRRIPVNALVFERQGVGFRVDGAEQDEVWVDSPIFDNGVAKPRQLATTGDEPNVAGNDALSDL